MNKPIRNNHTQTQTQTHTKHRPDQRAREGVGRSRVRVKNWKPDEDGMPPWSERKKELFDWAARNLPDQHPALVVVAILSIRLGGVKPTEELVLERLTATGREASQIGYGPGGYAA